MEINTMINKWERTKERLNEECNRFAPNVMSDVEVADDVLRDLHALKDNASILSIQNKLLSVANKQLNKHNYNDVMTLIHIFTMLDKK